MIFKNLILNKKICIINTNYNESLTLNKNLIFKKKILIIEKHKFYFINNTKIINIKYKWGWGYFLIKDNYLILLILKFITNNNIKYN
jgi:hypothetical protein